MYDADIRKALHQEGRWYLIPIEYCFQYATGSLVRNLDSLVFHVCSKSWVMKSNTAVKPVMQSTTTPYTAHRTTLRDMQIPCVHCHEPVPESIITVWTLHNWDSLSLNEHPA